MDEKIEAGQLAIDHLEEAVRSVPNDATFRYHVGLAYLKNRNTEQARLNVEQALRINPNDSHADDIRKALSQIS